MGRWPPDAAGRLIKAAIELFSEQGYDATTVTEIAERAGLTKRTFFRHFPDKREVLFQGADELAERWAAALGAAPAGSASLAAVAAGFPVIAELFSERHPFAALRAEIIAANPELQERELIKLQRLAGTLGAALQARGVSATEAILAAQAGVTVFSVAFSRWVAQPDPGALGELLEAALAQLRDVAAPAGPGVSEAAEATESAQVV